MMFGIGLGEILLILFLIFIISPRDIPKVLRKIGQFFNAVDKLRGELKDVEEELKDVAKEVKETGRMAIKKGKVSKKKVNIKKKAGSGAAAP